MSKTKPIKNSKLQELINLVRLEKSIKQIIDTCKDESKIKTANVVLKEISRKIANIELFTEKKHFESTLKKAREIKNEVDIHYQPHSHKYCKRNIYNRFIKPKYKISIATFNRYLYLMIKKDGFIGIGTNKTIIANGTK